MPVIFDEILIVLHHNNRFGNILLLRHFLAKESKPEQRKLCNPSQIKGVKIDTENLLKLV